LAKAAKLPMNVPQIPKIWICIRMDL